MKKKCLRKCKSNSGASLVLALLLFLICAVVGSVVLTAATASVGRISQKKELLQRQEALRSAAELIDARMTGTSYAVEGTWNNQSVVYDENQKTYWADGHVPVELTVLQQAQKMMAEKLFSASVWKNDVVWQPDVQGESASADTNIVTRKKQASSVMDTSSNIWNGTFSMDHHPELPQVRVTCIMDSNGDITADLICGTGENRKKLSMVIKAEPIQQRYDEVLSEQSRTKERRVTYTINWEHAAISYGG